MAETASSAVNAAVETILARLSGVTVVGDGIWSARCPACGRDTFSLQEGEDGAVWFQCTAGCESAELVTALRLLEEPFNANFKTEAEARLGHRLWCLAMYGWRGADVPFPGDKPWRSPTKGASGRESIFERVKGAVRIEEFAGRFTTLRPAGGGKLRGLCPLHSEKTPSFFVFSEAQRWRCFGACASGGDVLSLAQRLKELGLW